MSSLGSEHGPRRYGTREGARVSLWLLCLLGLLLVATFMGPVLGPSETWQALLHPADNPLATSIVLHLRLPRLLVAVLIGAALGASGAALQGLFRNPLADPAILGVSPTAAFFCQLVLFLAGASLALWTLPMAACFGALVATAFLAFLLRPRAFSNRDLLLLGGIALGQVMGAASALLLSLSVADHSRSQRLMTWILGNLDGRTWPQVVLGVLPVATGISLLVRESRALDALALGPATATSLGVDIRRTERTVTLWASVLSGLTVALGGIIGFVGLLAPHFVRGFGSSRHRRVLVESALCGACLLVFSDMVARRILAPIELPVGVVTGTLGAPVFAAILWRRFRGTS